MRVFSAEKFPEGNLTDWKHQWSYLMILSLSLENLCGSFHFCLNETSFLLQFSLQDLALFWVHPEQANSKFWTANRTWNSTVCWKFNFFESVPYKTNIIWTLFDLISFWGGFPRFLQFRKQKTACLTNLFSGCTCCVETGHLICGTYRLTGFFTVGMTTNRVFRAGYTISFFVSLALSLLDFLRLYFLHL